MSWEFLFEILESRGFSSSWILWIERIIKQGSVGVMLNGEESKFFKTGKGLRQGDPLSPLLFNLVADALSAMLDKAVEKDLIVGVLDSVIEKGISHIQYADDTVLMTDGSDKSFINLKILLYCFEWLSGLKINYHKSEVLLFGYSQYDKERKANMLNCKLGGLPVKYLGIPVSNKVLGIGAFQGFSQ